MALEVSATRSHHMPKVIPDSATRRWYRMRGYNDDGSYKDTDGDGVPDHEDDDETLFGAVRSGVGGMWNAQVDKQVTRFLAIAGTSIRESVKDPYAPEAMHTLIDASHEELWDDVERELKEKILATLATGTQEDRLFKEFRLVGWPKTHPAMWPKGHCLPNPFNWLRARVLYALVPADASLWKVLRTPIGALVFVLGLFGASIYALNVRRRHAPRPSPLPRARRTVQQALSRAASCVVTGVGLRAPLRPHRQARRVPARQLHPQV